MKRSRSLVFAALTLLAAATSTSADLITPPAYPGVVHNVTCKLVNVSTSDLKTEIRLIDATSAAVLVTSGAIMVKPGLLAQSFVVNPKVQVYCRFVGATTTNSRAAMTIYNPATPDSTEEVVVPAT